MFFFFFFVELVYALTLFNRARAVAPRTYWTPNTVVTAPIPLQPEIGTGPYIPFSRCLQTIKITVNSTTSTPWEPPLTCTWKSRYHQLPRGVKVAIKWTQHWIFALTNDCELVLICNSFTLYTRACECNFLSKTKKKFFFLTFPLEYIFFLI